MRGWVIGYICHMLYVIPHTFLFVWYLPQGVRLEGSDGFAIVK